LSSDSTRITYLRRKQNHSDAHYHKCLDAFKLRKDITVGNRMTQRRKRPQSTQFVFPVEALRVSERKSFILFTCGLYWRWRRNECKVWARFWDSWGV